MKEITVYSVIRGQYEAKMMLIEWGDSVANTFDRKEALTILEKCKNDYDYTKSSNKMYGVQVEEDVYFVDDEFENCDDADEVVNHCEFDHCEDIIAQYNYRVYLKEKKAAEEKEYSKRLDDIITQISRYLSMKALCEETGISYPIFKNYKNGRPFSIEKKKKIINRAIEICEEFANIEID